MHPGTQLGHYTISSLIGKGGMGAVYQAKDEKLGRQVAIKVVTSRFLIAIVLALIPMTEISWGQDSEIWLTSHNPVSGTSARAHAAPTP